MGVFSVKPRTLFKPREGPSVRIGYNAGWASELVWTQRLEEKLFAFAGDRTLVVQSAVRHCTD
jgi:hypothetical protein